MSYNYADYHLQFDHHGKPYYKPEWQYRTPVNNARERHEQLQEWAEWQQPYQRNISVLNSSRVDIPAQHQNPRDSAPPSVLQPPLRPIPAPPYGQLNQPPQPAQPWRATCWDPPGSHNAPGPTTYEQPNPPGVYSFVHQRNPHDGYHQGYQPLQPSYHPPGQPPHFDRLLSHPTTSLPTAAAQPSRSTHPPQKPRRFIGQQRGLPNNPDLMVRSLSPAQLAAINDYNEKLRVYRLDQAALLARLNAWFEENTDNAPTMVLAEDIPRNAITNDGAIVVVPNDESFEDIVKNMSPHVLVEVYDDKSGDIIAPTHGELEIKDDVETLLEENVVCYEDITILIKSLANGNIGATNINCKSSRSTIMFTCIIESWCRSSTQSLIHYQQQRPCTFDPGGKGQLSTSFIASMFPP